VVTDYLVKSGLQADLDALGFNLVGYGCTTCIGNSGPLPSRSPKAINENDLVAAACSRATAISRAASTPTCAPTYLASPPLVVAYALKGTVTRT
jgi:aconitate hydratase